MMSEGGNIGVLAGQRCEVSCWLLLETDGRGLGGQHFPVCVRVL